ncbi:hypothetical protein LX16_1085 [Stackebrandtia albiflava]|uniref:Uncharacterized protein n=1 Tax=Stackebrandtia albiflava TaxID=406432 RepID=A0A562VBZ3_9ACTN|nr:hypothetical protein LX16_1085 [Stackebrandtia albiflava]
MVELLDVELLWLLQLQLRQLLRLLVQLRLDIRMTPAVSDRTST